MAFDDGTQEDLVAQAMPGVIQAVREGIGPHASDVIRVVRMRTGAHTDTVRHAIWRLIGDDTIVLTEERSLELSAA